MTSHPFTLVLAIGLVVRGAQAPSPPQPAAPPGTDIYLLSLTGGVASMKAAKPSPVSTAPGYDNQPMFSPDGARILFAANRDGKQIDVYVFDRGAGTVSQLTETPTNENSPTYLPAGLAESRRVQRRPHRTGQDAAPVALRRARPRSAGDLARRQAGGLSRLAGSRHSRPLRARSAGDAADRESVYRPGGDRRRRHRPIAASHPRDACRQLRAA